MKIFDNIPITLSFAGMERKTNLEFYCPDLTCDERKILRSFLFMICLDVPSIKLDTTLSQYDKSNDNPIVNILDSGCLEYRIRIEPNDNKAICIAESIATKSIHYKLFCYADQYNLLKSIMR